MEKSPTEHLPKPKTVPEYLETLTPVALEKLLELRALLMEIVPEAQESLKWGAPVLEEKRILFAYTAHKTHLNFMPTRRTLGLFTEELKDYKTGKDTLQLPFSQPLPVALIRKLAIHRVTDVRDHDARWM